MRIQAIPKMVAINNKDFFVNTPTIAVISIMDSGYDRIFTDTSKALTVWFDDIHPKTIHTFSLADCKAADYIDGCKILDFIEALPPEVNRIMVHCTAGICRSGAVATYLHEIFTQSMEDIFRRDNPHILPNDWVLDLLWMTHKMREPSPSPKSQILTRQSNKEK